MDFKSLQREKVHKTLINIASVSKKLHTVLGQANIAGGLPQAVGAWTRLGKIIITSQAILSRSLENNISLDPRLEDWLYSKEPDMCLHILSDMERLITPDLTGKTWWKQVYNAIQSMYPEDKINEAIKLFDGRQDFFLYLVTPGVWLNCETNHRSQPGMAVGRVSRIGQSDTMLGGTNTTVNRRTRTEPQEINISYVDPCEGEKIAIEHPHPESQNNESIDTHKMDLLPEFLDGLSCEEKHAEVISQHQPGTCKWLVQTDQYKEWRNSNNSFLWLQGKAGSGKTVSTAFAIEAISKTLQEGECLAFFYCDFRHEASTSAAAVLHSILSQLLRAGQDIVDGMAVSQTKGISLLKHARSIASLVSDTARYLTRQPIVVIDALDECHDIENLLTALRELAKGGMRLFVTSRPLQIIKDRFRGLSSISMEMMVAAVSEDIKLHVVKEIDGDRWLRILDPTLKREICFELQSQADGMFRWVQLQIDTLKKRATAREIRNALICLPTGLEETYERILCAIDPQSSEGIIAMRALVWMVTALRPLQLTELLEALAIDIVERKLDRDFAPVHGYALLDALGSLVVHNEGTDIINLSHFSVKEYLVGSLIRKNLPKYHIDLPAAHAQVLRLCMCYAAVLMNRFPLPIVESDSNSDLDSDSDLNMPHAIQQRITSSPIHDSDSNLNLDSSSDSNSMTHAIQQRITSSPMLQAPLLHYVFFHGFDHLKHLQPGGEVFDDMVALRSDIQHHPAEWARVHSEVTYLSWHPILSQLSPEHDFIVYFLIASLPESFLREFLRHEPFKAFDKTNPLIYATHLGKFTHAQTLLSEGIRVDHAGLDIRCPHELLPLEVAFYLRDRLFFNLFLMDCMAIVPTRLLSGIFCRCQVHYDTHVIAKLLQCNEFPEWVLESEGRHKNLLHHCLFDIDQDQLLEWTEEDLLSVLRRFIQVGCDLSAPLDESFQLVLRVVLHAISQGYTAVLQHLNSHNVPMPSRVLLSQGTTRGQLAFQPEGLDMYAVMNNGDLALQRSRGKCKHGSSCWSADCNLCSFFLNFMDPKKYVPVDILFVGRSGAGKSSLVNMITRIPEGLSSAAEVPNSHSGGNSRIASYAAPPFGVLRSQIWDAPGFAKTLDGQQIRTKIDDWFIQVSSSRCKRDLVINEELYLISPIIQVVWCMHESEMDDLVVWQQFRDVSEACRRHGRTLPTLIVINQTVSTMQPSDHTNGEVACENRLRQLGLPTSPYYLMTIRRNRGMSSPEYEEDSLALGQLIHQHVLRFQSRYLQIRLNSQPVSLHPAAVVGEWDRLYQCAWVANPVGGICGCIIRGSELNEHLRVFHGITGSRDANLTCCWIGCDRAIGRYDMLRHVRGRHLAWDLKVRFDVRLPMSRPCSFPRLHFDTSLEEAWTILTEVPKEDVVPDSISVEQDPFMIPSLIEERNYFALTWTPSTPHPQSPTNQITSGQSPRHRRHSSREESHNKMIAWYA